MTRAKGLGGKPVTLPKCWEKTSDWLIWDWTWAAVASMLHCVYQVIKC